MKPRFIDANNIKITVIGGRMNGKTAFADAFEKMIKEMPGIDAIPIEWMKQKYPAAVNSDSTRYISKVDLLNEIIEEWRKEE